MRSFNILFILTAIITGCSEFNSDVAMEMENELDTRLVCPAEAPIKVRKDRDGDGFGRGRAECANEVLDGFVLASDLRRDCDDENELVNPGMDEAFSNGIDDNCDGNVCEFEEVTTGNGRVILRNELEFTGGPMPGGVQPPFRKIGDFNIKSMYSECGMVPLRGLRFNIYAIDWAEELEGEPVYLMRDDDTVAMEGSVQSWSTHTASVGTSGLLNVYEGAAEHVELWMDTSAAPQGAMLFVELELAPVSVYVNTGTYSGTVGYYPANSSGSDTISSEWIHF